MALMVVARKTDADMSGTHLQGYVLTTYDHLVERFGEPSSTWGDKTTAEWSLDIGGQHVTIYDWKEMNTPKNEYWWHIGGRYDTAVEMVKLAMPGFATRKGY